MFLYIYYFFRSVFLRGLVNTFKLLRAEGAYEKQFGIATALIKKSYSKQFYHYQGASYWVLLKILPQIVKQTSSFTFFDIGCGKGRAVFVAEYCGYNNLLGIDLDSELITVANENLKKYKKQNNSSTINIKYANALDVMYKNEPTVYFLFNPFNEDILKKVLGTICSYTVSETWFVYMNPQYTKPFNTKNFKLITELKTNRYLEAVVYKLVL